MKITNLLPPKIWVFHRKPLWMFLGCYAPCSLEDSQKVNSFFLDSFLSNSVNSCVAVYRKNLPEHLPDGSLVSISIYKRLEDELAYLVWTHLSFSSVVCMVLFNVIQPGLSMGQLSPDVPAAIRRNLKHHQTIRWAHFYFKFIAVSCVKTKTEMVVKTKKMLFGK